MEDLISIIIPVYNVEKYISKCIKSIIEQTYSNLEIIIVDDGSDDESGKICDEFAIMDERIRVFHTLNYGVSHARNIGIENANGRYIGFVDSDDFIELSMYQNLINSAKRDKCKIVVCGYKIVSKGISRKSDINNVYKIIDNKEVLKEIFFGNKIQGFLWNKLFDSSLFKSTRLDEKMDMCEDLYIVCKLINKVKKVSYISNSLYNYVLREDSTTNSFSRIVSNNYSFKEIDILQKLKIELKNEYDEIIDNYIGNLLIYIYIKFYDELIKNKKMKTILKQKLHDNKKQYLRSNCYSNKEKILYLVITYIPILYIKYLKIKNSKRI